MRILHKSDGLKHQGKEGNLQVIKKRKKEIQKAIKWPHLRFMVENHLREN